MYLNARMIAVHTGSGPLVTEDPAEAGTAVRGGQCGSTSGGTTISDALTVAGITGACPFKTECVQRIL